MGEPILILGASARAAAQSARAAGLIPITGDLFADADLREVAQAHRVQQYPQGLEAIARRVPGCSWMYTGGLENHPELVDRIARDRPLLGNPGAVLSQVRSPLQLQAALGEAGLPAIPVATLAAGLPRDGSWLCKPLRHCGGMGVERLVPEVDADRDRSRATHYFQKYVAGTSCSAVYLAGESATILCGVTEQLIGSSWLEDRSRQPESFRYLGSCGPLPLTEEQRVRWSRLGTVLAGRFGLRGLFGVDAIEADGVIWPVEVNPRYTASVELLERATGWSAVANHMAACRSGAWAVGPELQGARPWAKAILFARNALQFGGEFRQRFEDAVAGGVVLDLADIPVLGTEIPRGSPICTVLVADSDCAIVKSRLRRALRAVEELLGQF